MSRTLYYRNGTWWLMVALLLVCVAWSYLGKKRDQVVYVVSREQAAATTR